MSLRKFGPVALAFLMSCVPEGLDAEPSLDASAGHLIADAGPIGPIHWQSSSGDAWKEFDRLVSEQKYEAASKAVEGILKDAKRSGDSVQWARSLIRWVQLRTALHGYETSVRFLREQEWPDDVAASTALDLFYARSLVHYAQGYSWEIGKRERVVSTDEVDLKKWTMRQIHDEARRAYLRVWDRRLELGGTPVETFAELLTPNNYPEGVRSTLRDAVTYLFVELLANTQGWTPEQSNEVYRLDLADLLKVDGTSGPDAVGDAKAHPLVRIASALSDLERWHAASGRPDAAFEARLERLRRLHASFTEGRDRDLIRADLEKRLPSMSKRPFGAMGTALLAEFVRDSGAHDALVRAREIAREAATNWPASIGGKRCLHIARSIEAPDYNIEAMQSDGTRKRSIGVNYKNVEKLYFRAYPVSLKRRIKTADDWNLLPDYREANKLVGNARPTHEWEVALEKTKDYRTHRAWVTPPMNKPGLYLVAASAHAAFRRDDNRIMAVPIVIGDIVLITRQGDGEVEVTVRSGSTGKTIGGVDLELYAYNWNRGHKLAASGRSKRDGTFTFKGLNASNRYFVYASKGRQVALDQGYFNFFRRSRPTDRFATLLYTDRSIYRPAQKLMWKAVVYHGRSDRADYRTAPGRSITVSLMDANHQVVEKAEVKTNAFGTASGEFDVPAGRMLGQWRVQSSLNGQAWVRVEEYKRPTFEARFLDPEKQLRLNRPASLQGEVKYYFGLPVAAGKVAWRVVRDPVYPWWWGWYGWGAAVRSQTVATGASQLDEDGHFTVDFTPQADERNGRDTKGVTYRYSVSADVTDEGGETRTASRVFRLGFTAVEAALVMETGFLSSDGPSSLEIIRSDLDGTPAPGTGTWSLFRLEQARKAILPADQPLVTMPGAGERFRTKGDLLRPRWRPDYRPEAVMRAWKDGPGIAHGTIEHGPKGAGKVELPALRPGAYRLRYETRDAFGAPFEMSREFIVAGRRMDMALPALLLVEKSSVRVGGTAKILVLSGLDEQPMTLETYRDSRRIGRTRMVSGRAPTLIEVPVTEDMRGGFGLTLTAVRDHQVMTFSQSVFVPWDDRELKVAFSTFRDLLRPGGVEKWTVKVTGPAGRDTAVPAAEVLAYMYDRSLDMFAPHSPPSPLSIFPGRTGVVWPRASLGQARTVWVESSGFAPLPPYPSLHGDQLAFYGGWGVGGPGIRGHGYGGGGMGRVMARKSMPAAGAPARMQPAVMADMAVAEEAEATTASLSGFEAGGMLKTEAPAPVPADERDKNGQPGPAAPEVQVRTDFSETAFWKPHMVTGRDGSASIEFTVPDSVTSWNVWVHAVTKDLKSGQVKKEARTVKDLMVRPYLPRFLREGDRARIKVVVNNASEAKMKGHLTFDVVDPDTKASLLADFGLDPSDATDVPFTVKAGGGTDLVFPVKAPNRVGSVAFRVTATSGDFSDGELRPIPVLPGRFHLAQSRFVTLKDREKRVMTFDDMKRGDDPTLVHDQMVVTVDTQLFYQVLSALPYLVNYPYECTEQTLNRFLSTGIVSSFYDQYPALKRMGRKMAKRKTRLETWDAADPNRKMALEEMPWLQAAKGGPEDYGDLINVLDPRIAKAQRDGALAKLKKSQTSSGAFPWFPGGRPSPWMTLYLLHGFSRGLEFQVDVPKNMIRRAWAYMHRHYLDEVVRMMIDHDCCWEFVTFLNFVISSYPDESWTGGVFTAAERKRMLEFSFGHWKDHAPYVKGQLALTLLRMDRRKDALLVWASVMDSAKTTKDQGTFWAPEERGWLWYNDTIETHAFALRTLMDIDPDDSKLDGLVLWLFLNKKLNHWKSTRATAEVVYSLARYLKAHEQLAVKEAIDVRVGDRVTHWDFEPDEYTGRKNQVVIPGGKIDAERDHTVVVEKSTPGYAFASATWHFSTEKLPDEARGDFLSLTRTFFKRVKTGREVTLEPLAEGAALQPGDEVEVHLSLTAKHQMEYVHLRDPRGAGFEPVSNVSRHKWDTGLYYYEEVRDSGENFFFERLPQGEYNFKYRVRAATAGSFKVSPATAQPMYAPEFNAYSAGHMLTVAGGD